MNNLQEWENSYSEKNSLINKNEYPSQEIVSIIMRTYGQIQDKSSINILDLGCGWGNNLRFLKDKGFSYSGVDFSKSAVEHCLKEHSNIYCSNLDHLPLNDNSFNFAFDRMAIQHNPKDNVQNIFNEVYRVLQSGGIFYSVLASEASYSFSTTFLTAEEIKQKSKIFNRIELDYLEFSLNNKSKIFKANVLTAFKI